MSDTSRRWAKRALLLVAALGLVACDGAGTPTGGLKLSREGVEIMPVAPPWYANPSGLDQLVEGFSRKILALLGEDAGPGWREDALE
mgnify:CR=1 FL=1